MRYFVLFLAVLPLLPSSALAELTMDRFVIGSAGGAVSNGTLTMELTVGESVAGTLKASPVLAEVGFWWSVSALWVSAPEKTLPSEFSIQGAPNPFSSRTVISYTIPNGSAVPVRIGVYDLRGRLIRTLISETKSPGQYALIWDGRQDDGAFAATGIYFTKFQASTYQATRRVVMVK
jgi:hypothetical protein